MIVRNGHFAVIPEEASEDVNGSAANSKHGD